MTDEFPNKLDLIIKEEALSNAELARLSGLNEKTVSKVRRCLAKCAQVTINKIVKGLNNARRINISSFKFQVSSFKFQALAKTLFSC